MTHAESAATVRDATADDTDQVFELSCSMALTFVPERDSFTRSYRAVLDDPQARLLVVEVQGEVGGYLLGFEHPAFFANGAVAWVEELVVRDDLRRRGLGGLLVGTYEDAVRGGGGRLVALATTRADDFYEALGYTRHAAYFRKLLA